MTPGRHVAFSNCHYGTWKDYLYLYIERDNFHSPLALAGMENQVLVVLGADGELVLCWVEDVEQQMTLAGAVDRHRHKDCKTFVQSKTHSRFL